MKLKDEAANLFDIPELQQHRVRIIHTPPYIALTQYVCSTI